MAKLIIEEVYVPCSPPALLEEFKQYASVPDNSRDAMLLSILQSALLKVQEYADRALLRCKARQVSHVGPDSGVVRLYLGGGEVVSVSEENGGNSVPFDALSGGRIAVGVRDCNVEIVFTTNPAPGDLTQQKATLLRYATALYDGETPEVLRSILNESL